MKHRWLALTNRSPFTPNFWPSLYGWKCPIPTYHWAAWQVGCWQLERAGGNPPQSLARRLIVKASGCNALKQRLAAWHVVAPPAESPNSLTLMYLGLAPSLKSGRDVLGSDMAHRMTSAVHSQTKLCGQWWWRMQQVDIPCLCPNFVPGRPNLSCPGTPLFAAADPSRPQSHPGCPKYSMVQPAALPLAENLPTSYPQYYSVRHRQDAKVQTKPHSQSHAVIVKDLQMFAQSQVLLDSPRQN